MYMQAVLEHVSGATLDELMRGVVFDPLAMHSSYFGDAKPTPAPLARGHLSLGRAIVPFAIIFLPSTLALAFIALIVTRVASGRWLLHKRSGAVALPIAAAGTFFFLVIKAGGAVMAGFFTLCFLLLLLMWLAMVWAGWKVISFSAKGRAGKPTTVFAVRLAWMALSLTVLLLLVLPVPVPLPMWFAANGNAASSLRTTALDMAAFLIELSEGRHIKAHELAQMQTPQIKVNEHVSWGLGVSIQHSEHGDCLWHWGSNPGSKSVMVIYPRQRIGVVVLSNSWTGSELVQGIAARALGGKAYWDY